MVLQVIQEQESINASEQELQDVVDYSNAPTLSLELNVTDAAEVEDDEEREAVSTNSAHKRPASCVLQLIDNKRKHLEKALFAAQRDKMLLEEAKGDDRFNEGILNHLCTGHKRCEQGYLGDGCRTFLLY